MSNGENGESVHPEAPKPLRSVKKQAAASEVVSGGNETELQSMRGLVDAVSRSMASRRMASFSAGAGSSSALMPRCCLNSSGMWA